MSSEEEEEEALLVNGVDCADIAPGHNGQAGSVAVRRRGDHEGGISETVLCNVF